MKKTEGTLTALACFGLSLALNGALLFSVSPYFSPEIRERAKEAALQKKDTLRFEFVEAPVKTYRLPPRSFGKISNRDALNQDATGKKDPNAPPVVKQLGPADQLSQSRKSAAAPSPETQAQQAKPKTEQNASGQNSPETGQTGVPVIVHSQSAVSKPQEPRREQPAVSGASRPADKIEAQEMAKTKSGGAALLGVTSFEATGSGMGEYMQKLKEKVWAAWFPYIAFKYPQEFIGSDAVLNITLDLKGEVKIVRVVESKGSEAFTTICTEAIQRASGFGALPAEALDLVGKDQITLRFAFHYR